MNIYKTKCALWLTFKRWNLAATKHDDTSFLVYQDMTGCIVAEVSFIHFYDELSPGLFQPLSKKKSFLLLLFISLPILKKFYVLLLVSLFLIATASFKSVS